MDYEERKQVKDALRDWLPTFSWDYFITVTFRKPVSAYYGDSTLSWVWHTLKPYHPGAVFLGTEQHLSSDLHVHGLLQEGPFPVGPTAYFRELFRRHGRSQVARIRAAEAVVAYCSKYVTKDLTTWNIWRTMDS